MNDMGIRGIGVCVRGFLASFALLAAGCALDGASPGEHADTENVADVDAELESQGPSNDQELRLRARFAVPGRGIVKFYEPSDGEILISEVGQNGSSPLITAQMKALTAVGIYETLSKTTAPATLVAAVERAAILSEAAVKRTALPEIDAAPVARVDRTSPIVNGGSENVAVQRAGVVINNSYDQWFFDNFCAGGAVDGSGWDWSRTWMHVAGSGSFSKSDVHWIDSTVSVYSGWSVHFLGHIRPWYDWSTYINATIKNGYWNQFHRINNSTDFDVKALVEEADPDAYHWCTRIATVKRLIIGSK